VTEEFAAAIALAAMVFLLLIEIVFRPWYGYLIPSSPEFVRQLTMWVALLGSALAARDGRLLALATGAFLTPTARRRAEVASATASAAVATILCVAAVMLVLEQRAMGVRLAAGLNAWMSQLVLPAGFGLVALRTVQRASPTWRGRAIAVAGAAAGLVIALRPGLIEGSPGLLWVLLLVAAGALGAPLVAVLGGLAVFLFMADGIPPPTVVGSAYELTTHPRCPGSRSLRLPGSCSPPAIRPYGCCASFAASSAGCPAAPLSPASSSPPSSRSSPVAPV
jgi:C4-dicarboxylate transporter, DctM subunit